MMDFGWKKKAERLRMVILSGAHQLAKELPPVLSKVLAIYRRVHDDGGTLSGGPGIVQEMQDAIAGLPADPGTLWEPIEIHGWRIQATLYLRENKLWWLLHAQRKTDREPSENDVRILDKVIDHLGGVSARHVIIGPRSSPPGEDRLPFGWWTWQNRHQLFDIQVNKDKKSDRDKIRIVPLGTRETEGYTSLAADDFVAAGPTDEKE